MIAAAKSPSPKPQKEEDFSLRLITPIRMGFSPLTIRAQILVKDPKQELNCPAFHYDWGDGCTSLEIEDCDPFTLWEKKPKAYAPLERMHTYYISGEYELRVAVISGSDEYVRTQSVVVMGRAH